MTCASSAAFGHVGGTSAMPSRYSRNEIVTVTVNVPSSAVRIESAPG